LFRIESYDKQIKEDYKDYMIRKKDGIHGGKVVLLSDPKQYEESFNRFDFDSAEGYKNKEKYCGKEG